MTMIQDYSGDFGPFEGKIWLNCSHQGPLPRVAVQEAYDAISWKIAPFKLSTERFSGVPLRLKQALGKLLSVSPDEIILANSASYGLHLWANGLQLQAGDEVLLLKGDFPSDILPWLSLRKKGVNIRLIEPRNFVIQPEELAANITKQTRVFCTTWVHSFSGFAIDLEALGQLCRSHGVLFLVNVSQAIGTRPLKVSQTPLDAITGVGFKWLCGPYGTGYCWIRPEVLKTLQYNQAYWLSMQTSDDLAKEQGEPELKSDLGAKTYDIFGTANFFNFKPWNTSIEYLLNQGIAQIADHNNQLVSHLIEGLDRRKYNLISPEAGASRSTLVVISHKEPEQNAAIHKKLLDEGIYCASRSGRLRFSPHLYNTKNDIDAALTILNSV
jgi:selenocysteine lyase/cysteine desulfurase